MKGKMRGEANERSSYALNWLSRFKLPARVTECTDRKKPDMESAEIRDLKE